MGEAGTAGEVVGHPKQDAERHSSDPQIRGGRRSGGGEAYELCREQIERYRDWLPLSGRVRRTKGKAEGPDLTETQRKVLTLRATGLRAAKVARQLGMATNTVYVHLNHIRDTLGARSDRE